MQLPLKRIIAFILLLSILSGCHNSPAVPSTEVKSHSGVSETDKIFSKVLDKRPSPSEAEVVGKRVDLFFSQIAQADNEYVKEITALGWGDVYDPNKLNAASNLDSLIKKNKKSKELLLKTFEKRKIAYDNVFKDLKSLGEQSLLAQAMHYEIENRYKESETGFATIEKEMREEAIIKLDSIDSKLKLFKSIKGKYQVLPDGQVAFKLEQAEAKKVAQQYLENILSHNKCTARQRTLGSFFLQNRTAVVARFHELTR